MGRAGPSGKEGGTYSDGKRRGGGGGGLRFNVERGRRLGGSLGAVKEQ